MSKNELPAHEFQPIKDNEFEFNPNGVSMAADIAIGKFLQAKEISHPALEQDRGRRAHNMYRAVHIESEAKIIANVLDLMAARTDGISWEQYAHEAAESRFSIPGSEA